MYQNILFLKHMTKHEALMFFFPKPLFYISHVYIQPAMFVFVASYSTNEHIDLHEVKQGGGHLGGSVTIAASERPVNVLWAAQEFYKAKAW